VAKKERGKEAKEAKEAADSSFRICNNFQTAFARSNSKVAKSKCKMQNAKSSLAVVLEWL